MRRTLGLLRRRKLLRNKWSMNSIGFTPTSLHRAEQATLMALSAKGQHSVFQRREVGSFRFLSAVDETTIPEPAVPVRRHQLNRPYSGCYRGRFRANAFRMSMTTGEWSTHLQPRTYQYKQKCHDWARRVRLDEGGSCASSKVVIVDSSEMNHCQGGTR